MCDSILFTNFQLIAQFHNFTSIIPTSIYGLPGSGRGPTCFFPVIFTDKCNCKYIEVYCTYLLKEKAVRHSDNRNNDSTPCPYCTTDSPIILFPYDVKISDTSDDIQDEQLDEYVPVTIVAVDEDIREHSTKQLSRFNGVKPK